MIVRSNKTGAALALLCLALTASGRVTATPAPSPEYTEAALLASKPPGPYCKPSRHVPVIFKVGSPLITAGYNYTPYHVSAERLPAGDLYRHPARSRFRAAPGDTAGWHYSQLKAMRAAGLNLVMPTYAGDAADDARPATPRHWAIAGLPPLVKAARSLRRQTGAVLPIGMAYDTATLTSNADNRRVDLSTPEGRAWFYVAIRNFYSCIPPDLRATVDGKPLVFICPINIAESKGAGDPRVLEYVRMRFFRDFGMEPYLISHAAWGFPNADAEMRGDSRDASFDGEATAFSPGYRQSPWDGPLDPVTDRERGENGGRYRGLWEQLLARDRTHRPSVVILDSWNEWHNDTALAPSREYGETYVRLTRHYADIFTGRMPFRR